MLLASSINLSRAQIRLLSALVVSVGLGVGYIAFEVSNSATVLINMQSIFRDDQALSNTAILSRRIADMETLGIISCVSISSDQLGTFYSTLFKSNCDRLIIYRYLGATRQAVLRSLSGDMVKIFFVARSGRSIFYIFCILTILSHLIVQGALNIYWQKIDTKQVLNNLLTKRVEEQSNVIADMKAGAIALTKRADLALQVSHDIRSPLSALKVATKAIKSLDSESASLLGQVTERIESIASDLLQKSKADRSNAVLQSAVLANIHAIVAEKSICISDNIKIKLADRPQQDPTCCLDASTLQRMLSNIINNSLEAMGNGGTIEISVYLTNRLVQIRISDDGAGIPEHVLKQLGNKGVTFGKKTSGAGNGLGLYHAQSVLNHVGGRLAVKSDFGSGTTVTMTVPLAEQTLI